jgi:hypothetical protein
MLSPNLGQVLFGIRLGGTDPIMDGGGPMPDGAL